MAFNPAQDLSDLIVRREADRIANRPGDKTAMKRLASEITRRTDLKRLTEACTKAKKMKRK